MGQISVTVNGRPFTVTCDDGQEGRIRRLAQYVDAKVGEFAANIGQVGDAKLLLLAALSIADELADANETLQQAQSGSSGSGPDGPANSVNALSRSVEAIAARLRTP